MVSILFFACLYTTVKIFIHCLKEHENNELCKEQEFRKIVEEVYLVYQKFHSKREKEAKEDFFILQQKYGAEKVKEIIAGLARY